MIPFIVLTIGPALVWIWLFTSTNRYRRPDVRVLLSLFVGGMACGMLALLMNHIIQKYTLFWPEATHLINFMGIEAPFHGLGFWMMVGFNEEFAKLCVLLFVLWSADFQEPFDGLVYSTVVALGFATIENVVYIQQYGESILATRAIVTLPAHTFMSAPLGYHLAKAHFLLPGVRRGEVPVGSVVRILLSGWLISAFLHGLYDALLSLNYRNMAYAQIGFMILAAILMGRMLLSQSRLSPKLADGGIA